MSDTTITEYGIQDGHGDVAWPNDEGVLHIPNATGNHAIEADDLEALREALANPRPGVISRQALVQRTVTYGSYTPVPDPLPTTAGSVVRATVFEGGKHERVTAGLTDDADGMAWVTLAGTGGWFEPGEFTNVTILFDAATVKGD